MTVYIAQDYVAFDSNDDTDAWALGQAKWIKDNTQVLTGQALVVPGTAGERSSYCVVSQLETDGTLTPLHAWHVNDIGLIAEGLPDGSATPPVFEEWSATGTYAIDDVVVYQTVNYRCLQAHPAQVGWEPPNAPSLWVAI